MLRVKKHLPVKIVLVVPSRQITQLLFLPCKYIRIWAKHIVVQDSMYTSPKKCIPTVLTRAKLQTKASEPQYSRDKTLLLGPFLGFPSSLNSADHKLPS